MLSFLSMNNISIKQKLSLITVLSVFGALLLIFLRYHYNHQLDNLHQAVITNQKIKTKMLELRRNEKDFLARLDAKYIEKFDSNHNQLMDLDNQLMMLAEQIDFEDIDTIKNMGSVFQQYKQAFYRVFNLQQEIGLDHKSGLYGSLRNAVRDAEGIVKPLNNNQLLADILMLRRREKDFMLRWDPQYIEKYQQDFAKFQNHLASLSMDTRGKNEVTQLMQKYRTEFIQFAQKKTELGLTPKSGEMGTMRSTIHQSETLLEQVSKSLDSFIDDLKKTTNQFYLTIASMIILIMISLIIIIYRSINKPLQKLTETMSKASDNHDLGVRCNIQGNHELAMLSGIFDSMMESFTRVLNQINKAADQINNSSQELVEINNNSSTNITTQQSHIEQVATAMNQMSTSVQDVASNILSTSNSADEAFNETSMSKEKVAEAIKSVNVMVEQMQMAKEVLDSLEKDSVDVTKVLEVIRGVAEQTNLLALNAAIEAARAGEQGRGFAVVADEVRTLAGRTQQSTEEINEIIERLQTNSKRAVEVMDGNLNQMNSTMSNAQVAGESLETVTGQVDQINKMSTQIASAAEEQNAVADDINQKVIHINDQAIENTNNVKLIVSTTLKQTELAKELKNLVSKFKY